MDRFQAMQAFTRIVELGAFGKAADSLELPRASVTQAIQQLEAHLGVQLLQRTTPPGQPDPRRAGLLRALRAPAGGPGGRRKAAFHAS
ncbi:putative transcriptional regulator [Pseudomonas aeruginosa]|nr:putative transcriptional regulator [Pseudomonas aeruginosa]